MKKIIKFVCVILTLMMLFSTALVANAYKAEFEYKLIVTDGDGRTVSDPRSLAAGDTLNIEIELSRTDTNATSYETYGLEFRLMTRGLTYNNDGACFRNGTPVKLLQYDSGDSVGFAYYDMERKGEQIANPVLAGKWSYTVADPSAVNITVPVALMYIVNDSESYEPIGNALFSLDLNGGQVIGTNVSGEYRSGTIITLPDAKFGDYVFKGWSDGVTLYPAGSNYTVTGIVTLTAQWEGLVRDRQIIFDPQGGAIEGEDPGGMYAEGEVIKMPQATKEGFTLAGWRDGDKVYLPGDEYIVDNSKVFIANWKELVVPTGEPTEPIGADDPDAPHIGLTAIGVLALLGFGWWLFIILWKRRWVKYSLKNGDVSLDFKDKEHTVRVEVLLLDGRKRYTLTQSGLVEKKHRLRFIKATKPVVEELEKGKYDGYLILTGEDGFTDRRKCRIKVLDKELRERENK